MHSALYIESNVGTFHGTSLPLCVRQNKLGYIELAAGKARSLPIPKIPL
ncbi:MAG: hypothetical protein AAGJ08_04275 [Cyanobacteria bacterium P01_H01_bin.35]